MNFLDKTGLSHFWSKIKSYIASKKYISSSNDSIKNIVELTYDEYKALEDIDPDTEYHIKEFGTDGSIESIVRQLIQDADEKKHPVGSLEFNVNGLNPNTYLGFGTWELWGSGRVPIGVDTSQTEFNIVEKTGGEKTHKLTTDEIPTHTHGSKSLVGYLDMRKYINGTTDMASNDWVSSATNNIVNHSNKIWTGNHSVLTDAGKSIADPSVDVFTINATHEHSSVGGSAAHNNLQPFITCYMWKRVS